jgi:hypothetical protein
VRQKGWNMGSYTQLAIDMVLKHGVSQQARRTLDVMLGYSTPASALPEHPLFHCQRWTVMLCCGSAYFAEEEGRQLVHIGGVTRLICLSSFKDYDNEVEKFFDWITPFVYTNRSFAASRNEENKDCFNTYWSGFPQGLLAPPTVYTLTVK